MNFVQLLRKANDLKAQLTGDGGSDAWVTRQALQDAFHRLLLLDLETALDRKLEQELWNHVFKNLIASLQHKARDRMNPKRSEVQAMLSLLLDNASGFYIQLLQEICSAFNVQLACRIKAQRLGLFLETLPSPLKLVQPKAVSCHYICQHCLVHLGDIARYRNDTQQAESFYCHAASLVPSNGQPYNQLAIVSATKGDQLSMAFYYIRSIAVKHPFPAAATNLQTTYAKLVDRDEVKIFKMREVELIHYFIKFHAIIYLATCEQDLQVAGSIKDKLEENFRSHLSQEALTSRQLTQMAAINLFALHSIRQHADNGGRRRGSSGSSGSGGMSGLQGATDGGPYVANNLQCWALVMGFTFNLLQMMLHYAPQRSGESPMDAWPGLPAVRLLLGWIYLQPAVFDDPILSNKTGVWSKLGRVLSSLQVDSLPQGDDSTSSLPLPEDYLLDGFTPLQEFQRDLDFGQNKRQGWNRAAVNQERGLRLVSQGKWLAHHQPSLLKVETSSGGKLGFTSPLGDDVTSRRSSHHQQRQQRAAKTGTGMKGVETASKGTAVDISKKPCRDGAQRKDGSRERGGEEDGGSKTIAVQAIMSRPSGDINKPSVTFKGQERSGHGGQGSSGSKTSRQSPSSGHSKESDGPKRHVQWQNPPHAFAQELPPYYSSVPQQQPPPVAAQGYHPQGSVQQQGPQPPQGHMPPHGHPPPTRHSTPSGPFPQPGSHQHQQQQQQPRLPHPHPSYRPPHPASMGMPPDTMFPPPPLGPPPPFPPPPQTGVPSSRPMLPPPASRPPPNHPHTQNVSTAWQQVPRDLGRDAQPPPHLQRDGPPSPQVLRDGMPAPHVQPPKVQIPPPGSHAPNLSSPNHQPQAGGQHHHPHPHHQGGWPVPRGAPLPPMDDRPSNDTMTNISMWSAPPATGNPPSSSSSALHDNRNPAHLSRGGVDSSQYPGQHAPSMGRDTSPMRSPIGNSTQFRLSPLMDDFGGSLQQGQPQPMQRRSSNPSEMQRQGFGPPSFDQGRMNYMSQAQHEQHNSSLLQQKQQQQQQQQQRGSGGPPPHQVLDSQGANLLELLAKMQKQIIPETGLAPAGGGTSTKMGFSSDDHPVEALRTGLDGSSLPDPRDSGSGGMRDPPGFHSKFLSFPEAMNKDAAGGGGRMGVSDYYQHRMQQQQEEPRGLMGYNSLAGGRPQGESAFRKVHPQQSHTGESSLFLRANDTETKPLGSFEPADPFSFFSMAGGQQESEQQQRVDESVKYSRDIFGHETGLQESGQSFPYRRSSGSLYETTTSPSPALPSSGSTGGGFLPPGAGKLRHPSAGSDSTPAWRLEDREGSREAGGGGLLDFYPGQQKPSGSGGGGSSGSGGMGREKRVTPPGFDLRWSEGSREQPQQQLAREGARRASHEALFSQVNSGKSGQTLFHREPFLEQESSSSYQSAQHGQSTASKDSYFSGSAVKGRQADEENVFSSSGSSYSLFSSPSPWSARQDEDGAGLNKASGEGLGGSLGLKWREPQLSSSPTSSLLPERIQSIWSSPLRSEQSPLEKILGHKVSLEQQKPDT